MSAVSAIGINIGQSLDDYRSAKAASAISAILVAPSSLAFSTSGGHIASAYKDLFSRATNAVPP